jgi:hypothetical protein
VYIGAKPPRMVGANTHDAKERLSLAPNSLIYFLLFFLPKFIRLDLHNFGYNLIVAEPRD